MRPVYSWLLFVPASLLLAATLEAFWLQRRGHYDWRAYFTSLGDMILRAATGLLPLGLAAGALSLLWRHRLYTMPLQEVWPWVVLFFGQEFCYYWMHRADHRVRWLWATHSVHHSPETLNLSAAYRLGWTARLSLAPIFFAPLVVMGFPVVVVGGALAANLFYQFWLHATWIPKLGPLEWVLNTPAHHRIHHASNAEYLDRNYGGVLIVFDRLFGSFMAEQPGVVIRYGLTEPVATYNPLRIGLREWFAIVRDVREAKSLKAAFGAAFGPPLAHAATASPSKPTRNRDNRAPLFPGVSS
jgi:sterol desaturase/sphingolipid hydroxylase (fatty acid hydroxylase superfamily)